MQSYHQKFLIYFYKEEFRTTNTLMDKEIIFFFLNKKEYVLLSPIHNYLNVPNINLFKKF